MAEKGPLVTEDEFRALVYDMAAHSPAARAIADRWTTEHFAASAEIEEQQRRDAEDAAAAAQRDAPPAVPAAIPGSAWAQPGNGQPGASLA